MIRVVMLDLGMTLIDSDNRPFAHVETALRALANFVTGDGQPLQFCLVSDFTIPEPPATKAKVAALFEEYIAILDTTGLRSFLEPVSERITLSTHAGVQKPNRRIFETALLRLGADASLEECLFVTENAAHIRAARDGLRMTTLKFRSAGSPDHDFDDWSDAPALIADLVAPHSVTNIEAAAAAHLAGRGLEMLSSEPTDAAGELAFSGQMWSPVSIPEFENLKEIHVAFPVKGKVARGKRGAFRSSTPTPSADEIEEATAFVRSLAKHGQIAGQGKKAPMAPTHEIKTDDKGNRRLVRKRFTAF